MRASAFQRLGNALRDPYAYNTRSTGERINQVLLETNSNRTLLKAMRVVEENITNNRRSIELGLILTHRFMIASKHLTCEDSGDARDKISACTLYLQEKAKAAGAATVPAFLYAVFLRSKAKAEQLMVESGFKFGQAAIKQRFAHACAPENNLLKLLADASECWENFLNTVNVQAIAADDPLWISLIIYETRSLVANLITVFFVSLIHNCLLPKPSEERFKEYVREMNPNLLGQFELWLTLREESEKVINAYQNEEFLKYLASQEDTSRGASLSTNAYRLIRSTSGGDSSVGRQICDCYLMRSVNSSADIILLCEFNQYLFPLLKAFYFQPRCDDGMSEAEDLLALMKLHSCSYPGSLKLLLGYKSSFDVITSLVTKATELFDYCKSSVGTILTWHHGGTTSTDPGRISSGDVPLTVKFVPGLACHGGVPHHVPYLEFGESKHHAQAARTLMRATPYGGRSGNILYHPIVQPMLTLPDKRMLISASSSLDSLLARIQKAQVTTMQMKQLGTALPNRLPPIRPVMGEAARGHHRRSLSVSTVADEPETIHRRSLSNDGKPKIQWMPTLPKVFKRGKKKHVRPTSPRDAQGEFQSIFSATPIENASPKHTMEARQRPEVSTPSTATHKSPNPFELISTISVNPMLMSKSPDSLSDHAPKRVVRQATEPVSSHEKQMKSLIQRENADQPGWSRRISEHKQVKSTSTVGRQSSSVTPPKSRSSDIQQSGKHSEASNAPPLSAAQQKANLDSPLQAQSPARDSHRPETHTQARATRYVSKELYNTPMTPSPLAYASNLSMKNLFSDDTRKLTDSSIQPVSVPTRSPPIVQSPMTARVVIHPDVQQKVHPIAKRQMASPVMQEPLSPVMQGPLSRPRSSSPPAPSSTVSVTQYEAVQRPPTPTRLAQATRVVRRTTMPARVVTTHGRTTSQLASVHTPRATRARESRAASARVEQSMVVSKKGRPSECRVDHRQVRRGRVVGSGTSAVVYVGDWKGTPVAIKQYKGDTLSGVWDMELRTVMKLRHPNLVLVLGYLDEIVDKNTGKIVQPMCLLSEYCNGGSLFHALHQRQAGHVLTWRQRLKILYDIAVGCTYLHSQGLIHRDLKSLNILLDRKVLRATDVPKAKISDFGMCVPRATGRAGTYQWMAPEVFLMKRDQGPNQDLFSFGILIYECVASCIPYAEFNEPSQKIAHRVATQGLRPSAKFLPNDMPRPLRHLMEECWQQDPGSRPSFQRVSGVLGILYKKSYG